MNKTLVAIFESEEAAFNGLTALKELHRTGDITLYDAAVIAKDNLGNSSIVKEPANPMTGTFLGMFVGALVGVFAGPVGVALGAATGTALGATTDLVSDSVDYGFVEQVRGQLTPGKVAVIADVEETWVTPVNLTVYEHGGIVFRRLRHEVVEDQLAREHAEFEEELKDLKKELSTATGNAKARIQERISSLERSLMETRLLAESRAKKLDAEWEAKRHAMEQQLKDASLREKTRIKSQLEKAKAEYETRTAKLRQAQELVAAAFKP
jgi:uncharacterized membrane protein